MTVMENMLQKKVNIKFTAKSLRVDSETEASCITKKSDLKVKVKLPALSNKRKSELVLDMPEEKRRKMDQSVKHHCGTILKGLLNHPAAWLFKKPVDPVALNVPDYFSVISDPMDLGTIKSKLEDNLYFSAEEFAADVSLTFSNAMLYNPPHNRVHQLAEKLDCFFKRRWKFQFASWNRQTKSVGIIHNGNGITAQDTPKVCSKKSLSDASFVAKKSNTLEEKDELRKEVMVLLRSLKRTEKLQNLLQKFNVKGGEIGPNITALDVSALKDLKRVLKGFLDSNSANVMPTKVIENGLNSLSGKVVRKGICGLVNSKPSVSSISSPCGLCRGVTCQCGHQMSKLPASSNEKSLEDSDHAASAKSQDSEVKISLIHANVSDWDSDGSGSVLDEDNTSTSCGLSVPATTAGSAEGCSPLMDEQSLKKALRAAMLKSRFADTIMKANGDKADPRKMHQERERLERLQREEAAKVEAQLKEEQLKLKMQLEKDRQAARMALEKMQRTVEVEDNMKASRELEKLSQCSSADFFRAFGVRLGKEIARVRSPLELLGLYMKEDYMDEEKKEEEEEEAILNGDREEGEIIQ